VYQPIWSDEGHQQPSTPAFDGIIRQRMSMLVPE
jgi:hypothetical protein